MTKKVHFIAIGGSAMHNLAIALSRNGYKVTGSDDEIFEPSASRLKKQGIYPSKIGWNANMITSDLEAVILGMHARNDNPELLKAKELEIPIYSYPEYLYQQSINKKRIVIGGSHGKTTITSMILHVVSKLGLDVDYMVGAQLEGYDCMVKLTDSAPFMILEGDEYLSSPIDRRPKFHLYKPHAAIISGIAWDHINVFPTFENYIEQFDLFCNCIEPNGTLVYNNEDTEVKKLGEKFSNKINTIPYNTPIYNIKNNGTEVEFENKLYSLKIFGEHNLQNVFGAMTLSKELGITPEQFLNELSDFQGAGKRLQKVVETDTFVMFKDFAHSPSKLMATTKAVKEQYPDRELVACMELHTFSSLKKEFLPHYENTMDKADHALVYFNPHVVEHKKLEPISVSQVKSAFGGDVSVVNETKAVLQFIKSFDFSNKVLLMMSSGTFDGINYDELGEELKQ
ncbi:MAG: UDP-N-acetylmuramate--L-alanine ligase [Crocinitomicaceae bacterium]|jgi:UDP-N-acetylmuramate: L-alanyl-gamma-D-glutamyl-meso-diaminopimelate ligase